MTTTAPYLVIGTSPFNGMDTVDECDSLEEARVFANEHGGRVVPASEYRPKGLLEDWFNNEPEDFGVLPASTSPQHSTALGKAPSPAPARKIRVGNGIGTPIQTST